MKRLRLAGLFLLSLIFTAGAGTDPDNTVTYVFQTGVLPSASYAGCDDTYLSEDSTTTVHGNFGLLRMNSVAASPAEKLPLIRFRFRTSEGIANGVCDTNPDSVFVLDHAWVGLYKPTNTAGLPSSSLNRLAWVYRCLSDWNESEATWVKPFTAAAFWPGGNTADAQGLAVKLYRTGTRSSESDSTTLGSFWTADSLWNSVYNAGGGDFGDYASIPAYPDGEFYIKQSAGTTNTLSMGWHFWNATPTTAGVLRGRMKNNGHVLTNSTSTFAIQQTYASSEYTGWIKRRPMFIVKGHYILAAVAAVEQRNIGGTSSSGGPH